jgi:hypothetical protein
VRQPILYAEEMWRRQRFWVAILIGLGIAMSTFLFSGFFAPRPTKMDINLAIWPLYIPSGLLLGGILLYYRRRSYVQAGDDRIRVSNLLNSVEIDYGLVRGVKVQPLQTAFQEAHRKRQQHPLAKPYLAKPALFIRLKKDDPATLALVRKLGPRLAYEDTIALPIPDPDAFAWEITSRLPDRLGQNLGGRRRRKRR